MKKVEILPNAIYTTEEVAGLLDLTVQTIQKYIRSNKIEATLVGGKWYRITGQAVRDFIELCKRLRVVPSSYKLRDEDKWIPRAEIIEDFGSKIDVKMISWPKKQLDSENAANHYARLATHKFLSKDRNEPEDELAYVVEER